MNVNAISSLSSTPLLHLNRTSAGASRGASAVQQQPDVIGLTPAAKFLSQLQQLQAQNPLQFQAILSEITNQLQQASASAAGKGNTAQAIQLTKLAQSFQSAASGGMLPGVQQLQEAGLTGQHQFTGGRYGAYSTAFETQNQNLAATLFNSV